MNTSVCHGAFTDSLTLLSYWPVYSLDLFWSFFPAETEDNKIRSAAVVIYFGRFFAHTSASFHFI